SSVWAGPPGGTIPSYFLALAGAGGHSFLLFQFGGCNRRIGGHSHHITVSCAGDWRYCLAGPPARDAPSLPHVALSASRAAGIGWIRACAFLAIQLHEADPVRACPPAYRAGSLFRSGLV